MALEDQIRKSLEKRATLTEALRRAAGDQTEGQQPGAENANSEGNTPK